ncbi:MAG: SLC13 family permease [Phycisphaerales bacterium]|nr:SLC13 family permease [Phycisphaerales bacterium]
MTPDAWITLAVLVLVIGALLTNRINTDVVMATGLALLLAMGVIDEAAIGSGFGSPAVLMLAGLYVVAAGVEQTGAIRMVASRMLGRPRSLPGAQVRMMSPVGIFSGFMNTTPVVAIAIPIIRDWARRIGVSPSGLFMPLSFAAILGGKLTLIGTAANLIVMEEFVSWSARTMPEAQALSPFMTFFGIAFIGLPCLIAGIAFIAIFSRWLIPDRSNVEDLGKQARRYRTEVVVPKGSPVAGKTIEQAQLRGLPGLYLSEVERNGTILSAVDPGEVLQEGDRLAFVGALDSVIDLRRIRGLDIDDAQASKLEVTDTQRRLVEAVVGSNSPLIAMSVREAQFRTRYKAVIVAVHRQGKQVQGKIGDIVLRPGDTLLLETHQHFEQSWRGSDEFFLVSELKDTRPTRHRRAPLALAILVAMVVLLCFGWIDRVAAVWCCALAMIATRCLSGTEARKAIHWQVLIVVGASLGIAAAVDNTGLADEAVSLLGVDSGAGVAPMLFLLFIVTSIASQLVTPYAAAVLLFPFTMQLAQADGGHLLPWVFTLMMGAGCAFINPVGYQTNLMVYGPGGYRFLDFARVGVPLTILIGLLTAILAPIVYT